VGWGWDEEPPSPRELRLKENLRRAYDRVLEIVDAALANPAAFSVTPELICELHRIIMDGEEGAGAIRQSNNQVGRVVVVFQPPPWEQVPDGDGNGRTARALAYAMLCIAFGRVVPGSLTIDEQISTNPYPYWDALAAADAAWSRGDLDLSDVESLLGELLEHQIDSR
jgi:Fic family protein